MTPWRLLKLDTNDASANMAIDEAIMRARIKELVPNTVRFYRWNPSAVSIGRFQDISNEVYLETCQRNHVDIVRRITGGGTVYHDSEDEITYSVIVNEEGPWNTRCSCRVQHHKQRINRSRQNSRRKRQL